jgi:hypothetical protein
MLVAVVRALMVVLDPDYLRCFAAILRKRVGLSFIF